MLLVECNSNVDLNFTNDPFEQDERQAPKQQEFQAQVPYYLMCEI